MDKLDLGIYSWFGVSLPMRERLKAIKKAGFTHTMLWWGDQVAFWEHDKESLIQEVHRQGLKIENFHLPYEHINDLWKPEGQWDSIKGTVEESLIDCQRWQVEGIVLHVEQDEYEPEYIPLGLERLYNIVEIAEKRGIILAIENTKNIALVKKVLDTIKSPYLKLCYDSSHDFVPTGTKGQIIREYGSRMHYLHLSDNDFINDCHWIPGEGKIDFNYLASLLSSINYENKISFEVCPWEYDDTAETLLTKVHIFGDDFRSKLICR